MTSPNSAAHNRRDMWESASGVGYQVKEIPLLQQKDRRGLKVRRDVLGAREAGGGDALDRGVLGLAPRESE